MPRTVGYTTIPRDGLVGEWLLDGNANDTSGLGHHGTATNITYVSSDVGYVSQCASFNGSSSYVNLGNQMTDAYYSFSFWADFANPSGWQRILDFGETSGSGWQTIIGVDGSTTNTTLFYRNGSNNITSQDGIIIPNELHHYVVVQDGSNVKFYRDGDLIVTNLTSETPQAHSRSHCYIGKSNRSSDPYYNGKISQLRIYNRVLTPQEIQALYQEGLRKLGPTNLLRYPELFKGAVVYCDFRNNHSNLITGENATVNGATLTTDHLGYINSAYSFDNNATIDIPVTLNNAFTTSIWGYYKGKTGNDAADDKVLFQYQKNDNSTVFELNLKREPGNGNDDEITINRVDIGNKQANSYINKWCLYTTIADNDGGNKLYVNGEYVGGNYETITYSDIVNIKLTGNDPDESYIGDISQVLIQNRILSDDEIKQLYNLTKYKYIYPSANYSLPNLEEGKVLEISKPQVGGIYYDQSGNGNNGTATNVSDSTVGKVNVMSFNESSSVLSIPKTTMGIIGTQDFYVSGWYYLVDPGSGNYPMLFGSFQSASPYIGPTIFFDPYNIETDSNGDAIKFRTTADNQFSSNTTASSLYNSWHHIVMTRISGTLYLYIDGVLDNSGTDNTNIGAADEAYICRDETKQRRHGKTALVRVGVGKGLTATEVQQLYYSQKGNFIS